MSKYTSSDLIARALGSSAGNVINNIKVEDNTSNDNANENELKEIPELRHWRDLGSYLDTLKSVPEEVNNEEAMDSGSSLIQPSNYRICNTCGTGVLETSMADHIQNCKENEERKEKERERGKSMQRAIVIDDSMKEETDKSTTASPKKNGKPTKKVTKKRKNEDNNENNDPNTTNDKSKATKNNKDDKENKNEPPNKKAKTERKKKEPKQKSAKNKGPVDVERQCGVPLPNGGFCARSLTCKTHSMGAKRAVLGRSAPYDQLLAAYQRKNQAKIGAAAAAAQQAKDDLMHGAGVALDDEEETQQVLAGVRRSTSMPLERNVFIPTKMRTGYLRMKEMFASSLLPRLNNNPLGKMYSRAAVMNVENIGESSFFPVRSQHQKNNQQRQNIKQNANAMHLQMQAKVQAHARAQAMAAAQQQQKQQQQQQQRQGSQTGNTDNNMSKLTPLQQQQMLAMKPK